MQTIYVVESPPYPGAKLYFLGVVFRIAWFCGFSANVESFEQATGRAHKAAERLIELAKEYGSVFLVGHGIMNMLIAKQLRARGWSGQRRPISGYWQFSTYHKLGGTTK